jgi:hypothetical protein
MTFDITNPDATPTEGWAAWYRNATPEMKTQRKAINAARAAADEARRVAQQAERRVQAVAAMTDEGLNASIAAGGYGSKGGHHPRQASVLLTLPFEQRERAYRAAGTQQNLRGSIFSDCLHEVAQEMKRLPEGAELWCERTAREYREREQAQRAHDVAVAVERAERVKAAQARG